MAEPRPDKKFSGSQNLRDRMLAVVGVPGVESVAVPVLSRVHSTLREGGFNPGFDFYNQVRTDMLQGLRNAQMGEDNGSISFIRHDLTPRPLVTNGVAQSYVYGGTGYDHSTFVVENGSVVDELRREARELEPGENIIDLMAQDLTRRVGRRNVRVQAISGNIGQALIPGTGPHGELDGTPTAASQGVKGQVIELRPMGDMVRERLGKPDFPVTVANDTIAISDLDGAAIIGTGINKSLILKEQATQIRTETVAESMLRGKITAEALTTGKRIAVNLESGGQEMPAYTKPLIARIDAQLTDPKERDKHEIEKLVAGGYLYYNFNLAAQDLGLTTRIKAGKNAGKEIDILAESDPGEAGEIARILLIRSAMLEAAQLAAIHEFMGGNPITLIGDGSLITRGWHGNFKEMVQDGLRMFGVPEGDVTIETPDDVAMKGARGLLTGSIDLAA